MNRSLLFPIAACLAVIVAFLHCPAALPATITSGTVIDSGSGAPVTFGWVGLVRQSTLDSFPPGSSIWADMYTTLGADGTYAFSIDENDTSYKDFYVFSLSPLHFNRIYSGAAGIYAHPYPEDFTQPGAVVLHGGQSNPGIDFTLAPNRTEHRVLMRDGLTELATDVYHARPEEQDPTILMRTPYGKNNTQYVAQFTVFGYNVVIQDSRGRFESDGVDPVFRDDAWGANQDGYDSVEWIAAQAWSDGQVGMTGGSAMGITQYLTAGAAPPHLVCCHATVGSGNSYDGLFFTGGVFRKNMIEGWLEGQGSLHFLPDLEAHPNRDAWWDAVDVATRPEQVRVPFVHLGGWFDIMQEGATRGFRDFQHEGGDGARGWQKLHIGPWTHSGVGSPYQGELVFPANAADMGEFATELDFFDYWLKGIDNGLYDRPAVRYYVMGDVDDPQAPGNEWREVDDWPPVSIAAPFYFWSDGSLRRQPPDPPVGQWDETRVTYTYNPAEPAPTLGGANLLLPSGPYDQRSVEARGDVITFTSPYLDAPLEATGRVTARLCISSTATDTDFMVRLCDVYPDGRSMLIQEGAFRARHRVSDSTEHFLVPGEIYQVDVDLWSTSIVFNAGHRIRVSVTSSNDPRFDPNPNTGEPFRQHTHLEVAENTIHCSPTAPSRLFMPLVGEVTQDTSPLAPGEETGAEAESDRFCRDERQKAAD